MENKTLADVFDSYVNWLVSSVFLMAVNLAMEAGAYLVNETASEALNAWAQWPARGSSIAIAVAVIIWLRRPKPQRPKQDQRALLDAYVVETAKRAAFIAFILTLCLVAILDVITNDTQLPADFFIKLPGLSLTAGFSISFFLYNFFNNENSSEDNWTP
jgi:Na+/H+-translocating membrane pyrophosphatase